MNKPDITPGGGATRIDAEELNADSLLAPNGVEQLIRNQRVPHILKEARGRIAWALIPPQGTQKGDSYKHIPLGWPQGAGLTVEFFSPDGKSRGMASIVDLSETQITQLESRIDAAMKLELKRKERLLSLVRWPFKIFQTPAKNK